MAIHPDNSTTTGKGMYDAVILHIGTVTNLDFPEIPAQAGAGADIATVAKDDISNQNRLRMDICVLGNNRD